MPHKLNHLLFTFAFWLMALTGFAQTFPVTISTQINQPSPIYWSNYADATTSNSPIKIQIVLNDLTISNRQVRIKCYWQGNGISFMNNDFVVGAQPLFLEGGVPLQLTNVNLAPYFEFQNIVGITPNQYAQAIPEGIYTFSVEVYDVATGQKLSRKSNVTAVIFQNEPPLLNLPLNKASIIQQNIQNMVFSWTPRQINVSNVEYQFDLVEIWDQYTPVQNAFAYSPPIYTTTTRATTLQYGIAEPQLIPGKRYAWRIKAKALVGAEEIGVFKNNGDSEIFAFSYDVYCTPPVQIATDGVSQDQAKVTWTGALDNFDYQVNYREKNADSQWYPLETPREYATLANLKPNTTYEYTVGAACEKGKYVHSSLQEFTTLAKDEIALVTCGIRPDPVDLSNLNPLDKLLPNDVIKAGDFPIVVINATGSSGRFTGKGYVTLPLLEKYRKLIDAADNIGEIPKKIAGTITDVTTVANALANYGATKVNNVVTKVKDITGETINIPTEGVTDQIKTAGALISDKANALASTVPDYSTNIGQYTRIAVSFTNIGLNTDFKLIAGEIKASYDPEWKGMIDLDPVFDDVLGDAGNVINYEINFDIKTVIKNQDGSITITSTTGVVTVIDKTVNDIVITDKNGKQYTVAANAPAGPIESSGQVAPGGIPTPKNTNGMGSGGVVAEISSPDVSVVFTKGDGKYAFDTAPTTQNGKLNKTYASLPQKSGGTYNVPFKAISDSPNANDVIVATVDFKNGKTKKDLVFKTQNGTAIDSTQIAWNGNIATLTLKKTLDFGKETVIATVRPKEAASNTTPPSGAGGSKYDIAGTFDLWHLTHKKVNVTLVSVNGATLPNNAEKQLNEIYEPAGITFVVNTTNITLDNSWGESIQTSESGLLATYTNEQQQITTNLQQKLGTAYKKDTYYIIYTDAPSDKSNILGFMPLKRQYGFIFAPSSGAGGLVRTLAHELGHGVFGLEHPFTEYNTTTTTDLLMDYGTGLALNHNDWQVIHAPGLQLYPFIQGDSDGEYETDGHYSTVYLVSLMLGMNPSKAKELAIATEAPDTTIHSETKFELNDTWGHLDGSQQNIHSLNGGFHGIEEFFTAIKFLYAPKENIRLQGEMLHRFGDTYAHSQIGNLKPVDMKENIDLKNADDATIKKYIDSWKQIGTEVTLGSQIKPWVKFFNYYLEKDGLEFLNNERKQKEIFKGKTLKEALKNLYLTNMSSDFVMYGENGFTFDHAKTDDSYPDMIYLRPDWYYIYVQNLSWLISTKYGLDNSKLDLTVFNRMINFLKKHANEKPSMKGIIDYEIAKKLGKKEFYVPVFYSEPDRILASGDAVFKTNYLSIAKDVVNKTKQYLNEQGISSDKIYVEEINNWFNPKINKDEIFVTEAFKITIK